MLKLPPACLAASLGLLAASTLLAQTNPAPVAPASQVDSVAIRSDSTGAITGRVFNPATGEYIRNAQIRIVETGVTAISENEGAFRFSSVPAGRVTLVVTYTGYRSVTSTVDVAAGSAATKNFDLISTLQPTATAAADGTVKLEAFTVNSEREGSAKAIMDQRRSMNVTNTVASDAFGDNAEGNIGEFLRNMPGVELDIAYGEVRNVRLRGLSSEYTSVTVDGVSLASADANAGAAGNARAFTFESASLNSVEAIEVSKTVSADVDANSPAGTINLKTKRAFDRAGRRVTWQANVVAHSEEFNLNKSRGPDDSGRSHKFRPGGIFEYSDIFLTRRLGVVFNISESNVYQETLVSTLTYNRTTTPTDSRPEVLTALSFQHAPRFNKRFATTLTTDFKVTKSLALSLGLIYNYTDLWTPQRTVTFNTGGRASVVGDLYTDFTTTTGATVVSNPVAVSKLGESLTILPKFDYKTPKFDLEGKVAYSDATSWYDPLVRRHAIRDANSPTATGVNYRATRSSAQDTDWKFTQISGPDLADGASFSSPAVSINDGRFSRSVFVSGELNATLRTRFLRPIVWKTGFKDRYELRKFEDDQLSKRADYFGSATGTTPVNPGAWANYASAYPYDFGIANGNISSLSGRNIFMPDLERIARLYDAQPTAFRQNLPPGNYYTAFIANKKRYEEEIRSGYAMADTVWGRLKFRAGLRWEETHTDSTEFDVRTPVEVRTAGYTVVNGRATTIPGLDYQYFSQPKIHRTGKYHNFFPSSSVKLLITENLNLHLGYSSTIKRPTYRDLAGVWSINDTAQTVTAPNPNLKPETSQNYAARFAYYFEPVGQLSVSLFQNQVKDLHVTKTISPQEFGYNGDDDLSSYLFVTTGNNVNRVQIRGMEIEYSQALSFLPGVFKRLNVRAAYTRNYAEIITANLAPHQLSGGLSYSLGRFSTNVNATWSDNFPLSNTGLTYRRHRTNLDAGAGWRLSKNLTLSANVRNLLNTPYINMQAFAPSAPVWTRSEITGLSWTFAIKGTY
ncbi:MAG: TonB-dependent receptor [Undibacterium sp.]|nr:TonB-dependent receptor [Opitutaceae bacterium]